MFINNDLVIGNAFEGASKLLDVDMQRLGREYEKLLLANWNNTCPICEAPVDIIVPRGEFPHIRCLAGCHAEDVSTILCR